ncbi:MAG: hypothetical protein LBJ88_01160 [Campylobacteraceae bacterium]|jgi:hypothetical protein|nr:hypothetical protein [Campylobacteraceae bacterium]
MEIINFYKGFEREPKIELVQMNKQGNIKKILELWIGYFDEIVEKIKPNENGQWEGVPLFYHTETGWYDDENWKCSDLILFYEQLRQIKDNIYDEKVKKIYSELIMTVDNCVINQDDLYFRYK